MWIKEFNGEFAESMIENVNFLFQQDKIYIMDNHLCAAWCWLNEIEEVENNNLIHIDRHYDLLNHPSTVNETIIQPGIDLRELTYQEYEGLYIENQHGERSKTFRWDNYILNLREVYNNYYGTTIFSTFDFGNHEPEFIKEEISFVDFLNNIDDYINQDSEQNWILNVDIDYFFNTLNSTRVQVFSNEFIRLFAEKINSVMDKLTVITFCLSPECCGGWVNSLHVMTIFCEVLRIDFNLVT
ncbi:UPF0489 family protein [Flavobacterium sp. HSC-61S13]|uniref:UPF0489 family protein n=1 Tax=Flavobacterium sp. HSC-61S13 TaxID=2910963 RepID=UPI0020A1BDEE|nr:UPF0489 family protein [Flavobacterium sp. HSC-61S13]MCP1996319.1 hypothetical protein [Flavobacterium sp. HSC-61S13]